MSDFPIKVEEENISIAFSGETYSIDSMAKRMEQLLPLLRSMIESDAFLNSGVDEKSLDNTRALLSLDMSCQAHILQAQRFSEAIKKVALGEDSISQYGFPEFDSLGDINDS